jgi:hypothetical protein
MIPMGAVMSGVQGLMGIAGGIIGSGKRKREQRRAQQEFQRRKAQFENLDTSNVYAGLENVYEDLTVNQQQAEFANRAQQQSLANTMSGMQGAAGGSGIAALAQAMANQSSMNAERASVSIGQQERQNQMAQMQQESNLQRMEAAGELKSREAELNKVSTLMGMSGQRVQAANEARNAATQGILGGVGNLAGGFATSGIMG